MVMEAVTDSPLWCDAAFVPCIQGRSQDVGDANPSLACAAVQTALPLQSKGLPSLQPIERAKKLAG